MSVNADARFLNTHRGCSSTVPYWPTSNKYSDKNVRRTAWDTRRKLGLRNRACPMRVVIVAYAQGCLNQDWCCNKISFLAQVRRFSLGGQTHTLRFFFCRFCFYRMSTPSVCSCGSILSSNSELPVAFHFFSLSILFSES